MNERKRQQLLNRVERPSQTIGRDIPDELTVQGSTLDLTEIVFKCKRLEAVSEQGQERIEELKRDLQRERLQRKQRIARETVSDEEGERLVRSIHGIDRALNVLESIDSPGIEEQLRKKQIDDARELLTLLDQAQV